MSPTRSSFRRPGPAFTLVEVLVGSVILSLFLTAAYSLFFGGQRVAGRAAWLNYTVTDLRASEQVITKALQTTSYPSTLRPGELYDAGGTATAAGPESVRYYVHFPAGTGRIPARNIVTGTGVFMSMCKAVSERSGFGGSEDRPGEITWTLFSLLPALEDPNQGRLVMEERVASFTTGAAPYAAGLQASPNGVPRRQRLELVSNLEWVDIQVSQIGHAPSKVTITLQAAYPRDKKLFREGSFAAVPNVGTTINP